MPSLVEPATVKFIKANAFCYSNSCLLGKLRNWVRTTYLTNPDRSNHDTHGDLLETETNKFFMFAY